MLVTSLLEEASDVVLDPIVDVGYVEHDLLLDVHSLFLFVMSNVTQDLAGLLKESVRLASLIFHTFHLLMMLF